MAQSNSSRSFARLSPEPGKRILIAGGCGGVGRPLTAACIDMGLDVAVFALPRSLERHALPADVAAFPVDVTEEGSVASAVAALSEHWDGLDILVFLVGFMSVPPRFIDDMSVDEWDAVNAGNLRSAYLVSRAVLPMLRRRVGSSIVMAGSSLAYSPLPGECAYAAAKAGLVALTKSLAIENAPHVRANLVAPSAIDTPFLAGGGGPCGERAAQSGGDAWFRNMSAAYVQTIPMKRIAQPEDVIGPILFLAGPSACFITGQVLHVNGGRVTP